MPHKMMNPQIAYVLHDNRLSIEARMLYAYLWRHVCYTHTSAHSMMVYRLRPIR